MVCALVASLLLAVPSLAAAATFEVNTTIDTETMGETPCVEGHTCTLRDAIARANSVAGHDTITFAGIPPGSVIHVDEAPLPEILEGVTIEGDVTSDPHPGEVGILLEPIDFEGGTGFVPGISIHAGTGTRIEDLAIGGFGSGIEIGPTAEDAPHGTEICGDYLGTERDGETAEPNEVGVRINVGDGAPEEVEGTIIGGPGCAENVISGNSVQGIFDGAKETTIVGNRIGIGREGLAGPVPNGTEGNAESAGVYVDSHASGTVIGSAAGINLIGDNLGPGVLVANAASLVTIRHNSFFDNAGKGIEIKAGAPAAPVVTRATSPFGAGLTVEGTVDSPTPGEFVQLEFFGSDNCENVGEGRTILGSVEVENEGAIPTSFAAHLSVEVPRDERGITVTATYENGATSEFSACAQDERTYLVNTTADSTEPTECLVVTKCSLRGAVEAANETEVMDTIEFAEAAEGVIAPFGGLQIEAPIDIDGTSAPGYEGKPVVEIDGTGETSLGLWLKSGATGSTVSGLAIGGFTTGVAMEGSNERLCGSYVGVKADGTTALANEVGVSIEMGTSGDQVGAGCELLGDGNLISANSLGGIDVFGAGAEIAGNRIGVDTTGAALPNGEAGITLEPASTAATIGPVELEGANVISHNEGPGVTLQRPANKAQIRRNSIYANEGPGIEIFEEAPAAPTITKVVANPDSTTVRGQVTTPGFEFVELDVYASATCAAGAEGGQTYLGSGGTFGFGQGATEFDVEVEAGLPAGEEFVTVTKTGENEGQTSEFSGCFASTPAVERTFTVNSRGDEGTAAGCEAETDCTLRGAIEAANETENPDTINFAEAAEGKIEVDGFPLPEITEPVEIDGTSAPGYAGSPVVEVDGTEADNEGPVRGFETGSSGGVTIRGLAIGGFRTAGVFLGGAAPSRLCSSWVGIELDGTTPLPNGVGVETEFETVGSQIGVGCGAGSAPNVISANEEFGIEDFGFETEIGGNRIGVLPGGGVAGNEEGGIRIHEAAEGTVIGSDGTVVGAPESNQITNNDGPGVFVETGLSKAAIRGNSIYANSGFGIEIHEHAPSVPTITAVETGAGTLTFKGVATGGEGGEELHLDFYASAACAAGTAGGQTFLGSDEIASSGPPAPYEAEFNGRLPAGEEFMTVTETGSVVAQTSEFSACFVFVQPPRTFTVNSLGDGETAAGCIEETTCTLRGALEAANESEALDTIEFEVEGKIEPQFELPEIVDPVDIEGASAPGYEGAPVIEIDGEAELNNEGTEAFVIGAGGAGSSIEGLKIARFDNGIIVNGDHVLIESDTITGNGDIGIAVNNGAPHTAVRRSEIFANGTGQLQFQTPNAVPQAEVEAFVAFPDETQLDIPLEGALADHEYAIDAFADAHCESGLHGPLEAFLGSDVVTTNSSGKAEAQFDGVPLNGIDAEAFTVTVTELATGTTGAIGHCTFSPIETELEGTPPSSSTSSKATFTFSGRTVGHVQGFECSLDGAEFATCASPNELTGLADGPHEFKVRAYNGEGTRAAPRSYEWTVNSEASEIEFTGAPPAKTNSTAAKFTFVVPDNTVKVACKLDGAQLQNCESPVEFSGLAPGTHSFEVSAKEEDGGTSTATRQWKIITEAPSPAITTAPPATTETTNATFLFGSVLGGEISGYECSLDGSAFGACASPQSFGGLAPGAHSFSVRANDEAGNTSAPTTYHWTVAPAATPSESKGEPENGEKVVVEPTEGKIRVKLPGKNKYVNIKNVTEIPVGSIIDATDGRVTLTSISPNGTEQTAEFFGGVFRVKQAEGSSLVVLELLDEKVCTAPKSRSSVGAPRASGSSVDFRPSGHSTGKLWGSGHGNFRTEGHDGSATVQGTIWLVEDRCNGTTFFKTRRGIVTVRDFVTKKTLQLPAGKTYVAGEK